jgi:hypothetical protein
MTWGYNKNHRPDLKQLLYILTVASDSAVPLYFQVASDNVVDDQSHCATGDLLCRLTGRQDFVYVAVCKLASPENMAYMHQHQGRFLVVLRGTRSEDKAFRESACNGHVQWRRIHQLTVVERAFRVLKSELLLRPVWHYCSGRTQAHVMVCVLAYALWKTLDHLAKQAGLETQRRKLDLQRPRSSPKPRPMTPEVIRRELGHVAVGDILLETTDGRQLALRRVARPTAEPARILASLGLKLPERLSDDRVL